jgi:hypothetical protein
MLSAYLSVTQVILSVNREDFMCPYRTTASSAGS